MSMGDEEVRKAAEQWTSSEREFLTREVTVIELANHRINERTLAKWAAEELARRDAEAAERALPITEEWLRSIGAIIDAEDGVVEFCWLPGELVILSGGLLLWTVDCVEVGKIATRGQLLDVHGVIARS